jgi:uncharacterized protein
VPAAKRSQKNSQGSPRGSGSSKKKPRSKGKRRKGADVRTVIFAGAATVALALAATAILLVGKSLFTAPKAADQARPAASPVAASPVAASPVAAMQTAPAPSMPLQSAPSTVTPSAAPPSVAPAPVASPSEFPQAVLQGRGDEKDKYEAVSRPGSGVEAPSRATLPAKSRGASGPASTQARPSTSAERPALSAKQPASYRRPAEPRPGRKLVFIIDDVGNNISQLEPFLEAPFPLTFAVLPGLPYSSQAAAKIKAAGKEFILHQPMEALGGQNPGPGAIYLSTPPAAAARIVEENLDSLPGAIGLNNHEGSAVTRNEALMDAILGVAKRRGIYYLDSLTIAGTATEEAARREGIRYWERDVFLDNSPDRESIVHYIDVGKKKAEQGGSAVMIGHVWSAHLAATLMELYPQLVDEGFSLSTISELMLEESHADPRD